MTPIWILGGGGHARVVIDAIRSTRQFIIAGVLSDTWIGHASPLDGVPITGPITANTLETLGVTHAFIAIGDNEARRRIAVELDDLGSWGTIIHAHSYVAPDSHIAQGTLVCAGAIVQPGSRVGRHVVINTSSSVDHDCVLQDYVQIGPGAHLGGDVIIGSGGFIGVGASLLPGVEVGEWAVVGAGAVVTSNVPPHTTVVGVPARNISHPAGT